MVRVTERYLGYGHLRPGYWERENVLQKETFAQLVEYYMIKMMMC